MVSLVIIPFTINEWSLYGSVPLSLSKPLVLPHLPPLNTLLSLDSSSSYNPYNPSLPIHNYAYHPPSNSYTLLLQPQLFSLPSPSLLATILQYESLGFSPIIEDVLKLSNLKHFLNK